MADGRTRIINPAARRLLNVPEGMETAGKPYLDVLGQVPPLAEAIDESLRSQQPIVRRVLDLRELASAVPVGAMQLGVTVSPIVDAKVSAKNNSQRDRMLRRFPRVKVLARCRRNRKP